MAALAGTSAKADLQGFGVNFTANTFYVNPTDEPGLVATPNVPGANWNNIDGNVGSSISLHDYNANPNVATLQFQAAQIYSGYSPTSTTNTSTNLMYSGGLTGNPTIAPGEPLIVVTNIPYAAYRVYVYASADSSDSTDALSVTDGITTYYYGSDGSLNSAATSLLLTTGTTAATATRGPGTYQVFTETGPTFTLQFGGSRDGIISNNVFGFQIVPVPVPSAIVSLGVGGMVLAGAGLRRKVRASRTA